MTLTTEEHTIKIEARQNMELKVEKEEVLDVKYSFRRVYGIGKDGEWLGKCHIR